MVNDTAKHQRDRLSIWLILLLPVFVIAASSFVFYTGIGMPEGTTNEGELVRPARDIRAVPFTDQAGKPFYYGEQPFKWTLLIPGPAECDQACQDNLYTSRQMHIALGRLRPSLRRYYVVIDGEASVDTLRFLGSEHQDVTSLGLSTAGAETIFGGIDGANPAQMGTWYIADPGGFLMMYYSPEHTYKQVMADLKFLIKESGEI
jgi:hypothetical protein